MRHIDPCGLYSAEEARELLNGFVSLEYLRTRGGLKGLPGAGYFGGALLAALHRICTIAPYQGGRGAESESINVESASTPKQLFENREQTKVEETLPPNDCLSPNRGSTASTKRREVLRPESEEVQPARDHPGEMGALALRFKRGLSTPGYQRSREPH